MDISDSFGDNRRQRVSRKSSDFLLFQNDILLGADVAAGIILGYFTVEAYQFAIRQSMVPQYTGAALWREILLGSFIAALLVREPRLADGRQAQRPSLLYSALCQRVGVALALLLSVGLATRAFDDMARLWVIGWSASYAAWLALSRMFVVSHTRILANRGELREAVAVVGARGVIERLSAQLSGEAKIVAIVSEPDDPEDIQAEAIFDVQDLASSGVIDTVVLALERGDATEASPILEQLKGVPVQLTVCTEVSSLPSSSLFYRVIGGVPLAVVSDRPLKRWDMLMKAVVDRLGALILLIALAPLMFAVAFAIIFETPGPVIFRQTRRGWGGRDFVIYKFRTMFDIGAAAAKRQTIRNDPRCTFVGRLLRSTSIDELPQLWNVLCGDMSLVGPRPHFEALHEDQRAGCEIVSQYAQRQRVKPGMTGWAQINGLRGSIRTAEQMRRRVQYDLYYIDNWSIWLDLYILACTPLCILRAENAY